MFQNETLLQENQVGEKDTSKKWKKANKKPTKSIKDIKEIQKVSCQRLWYAMVLGTIATTLGQLHELV